MDKLDNKLRELHEKVKYIINKRNYTEYLRNRKFNSNTFKINSLEDMMNNVLKNEDLKIKRFYFNQYSLCIAYYIERWEEQHLTRILEEVGELFNEKLKPQHTNKIDSISDLIEVLSLLEKEVSRQLHNKKIYDYEKFIINLGTDIVESNKTELNVHYLLVKIMTFLEIVKAFESYNFIQLDKEVSYCNISYITEAIEKNFLYEDKENEFGKLLGIDVKINLNRILYFKHPNPDKEISARGVLIYEKTIMGIGLIIYEDSVGIIDIPLDSERYEENIQVLNSLQDDLIELEYEMKGAKNEIRILQSFIRFVINRISEKCGIGEMYTLMKLCGIHMNIFCGDKEDEIKEKIKNHERILKQFGAFIHKYVLLSTEHLYFAYVNNTFELESVEKDELTPSFLKSSLVKIHVKTNIGYVDYDIRMIDFEGTDNKGFTIDKKITTSDLRDLKIF